MEKSGALTLGRALLVLPLAIAILILAFLTAGLGFAVKAVLDFLRLLMEMYAVGINALHLFAYKNPKNRREDENISV